MAEGHGCFHRKYGNNGHPPLILALKLPYFVAVVGVCIAAEDGAVHLGVPLCWVGRFCQIMLQALFAKGEPNILPGCLLVLLTKQHGF